MRIAAARKYRRFRLRHPWARTHRPTLRDAPGTLAGDVAAGPPGDGGAEPPRLVGEIGCDALRLWPALFAPAAAADPERDEILARRLVAGAVHAALGTKPDAQIGNRLGKIRIAHIAGFFRRDHRRGGEAGLCGVGAQALAPHAAAS